MYSSRTEVGRLTKDPVLRQINENLSVCNFEIAVKSRFKPDKPNFYKCNIFGKQAETMARLCSKGMLIGIHASETENNSFEKDGRTYRYDVVKADYFRILESQTQRRDDNFVNNFQQENNIKNDPFGNSSNITIDDDDLPF